MRNSCSSKIWGLLLSIAGGCGLCLGAHADPKAPGDPLTEIIVIGTAPLPGSGLDIDKVPSNVQTISAGELNRDGSSAMLPDAAARRMPSVTMIKQQGSPYQADFDYRGFDASPISGNAQGLAVYQDGTRINEAFGDTVNWDLIPGFAVNRLTVQSNNPVFGLNALGGAVTVEMKTGFDFHESDLKLSAGSFGNVTGYGEYSGRRGSLAWFVALGGLQDDGFRYQSPTHLRQAYADIGYESAQRTVHLSVSLAGNFIGAVGPTPVQMLAQDRRSVFTYPQSMHNEMELLQLAASQKSWEFLEFSANAYFRHFSQHLVDGNTTNVRSCNNDPGFFCLQGAGSFPDDALYGVQGTPIPSSVLAPGATPGETDLADTRTGTAGAALQATLTSPLLNRGNHFLAGVSLDRSVTDFSARGELGTLEPTLAVTGAGIVIDQANSATAQPPIEQPVAVRATATYYGAYFSDAFDLTRQLTWSVSGRLNVAQLSLRDQLGNNLNSDHRYWRFNPGTGITRKWSEAVTAYAGYSESNRAPTVGELSCANPLLPCPLDVFLASDPELRQVVGRTFEVGLRGQRAGRETAASWHWNLALFRTVNSDDIMLLPTQVNGFGYYSNVGMTQRQGIETGINYQKARWDISLNYALVHATFRESLSLSSNSPAAGADGTILVRSGDRLPLTPLNRLTVQIEYAVNARWTLGADMRYVDRQYLVGDESNQQQPLPDYAVINMHGSLEVSKSLRLFAMIDNVLDKQYYAFGAFTQLDGLPPNFNLTDPRTFSPSPGRTFFVGVSVGL